MQLAKYVVVGVLITAMYSCKRDIPQRELLSNYEVNNYSELFEVFWKGINTNYMFWDKETVNWDSMYHVYKPKFDSLNLRLYSDTTTNLCFQYMADMTQSLKDGQYALTINSGGDYTFEDSLYKGYYTFIPKLSRTDRIRAALPDTLFDYIVHNNYLDNFDYGVYTDYYNTGSTFQIITGKINRGAKNILYTSLNTFKMKESYNANYATRPPRPVIKNLFDNIHKSNCDAIIIDMRNNRGGNLDDVNFFVGQFTSRPVVYGYARYKSSVNRLDYTEPLPLNITPQTGANDFNKQIVILTDIYTAAASEAVLLAFKALPDAKVTVVGERTYGTGGLIVGNDFSTNGGRFNLGSFGSVNLSNAALLDKDRNLTFTGIDPDIEVKYDANSIKQMLNTGVDIQLEKAIQFINK
ncbi:MAG TPA: S41 family peptidase [Chitinophagaceae bacterium]